MGIRVDKKKKEEEEKHFFLQQQREKGKLLKDVFFKVCGSYEGEGIPSAHPSKRNYCHTLKEVWGEIPSWWRVMGRRCPRLESDFKCFFLFWFFRCCVFCYQNTALPQCSTYSSEWEKHATRGGIEQIEVNVREKQNKYHDSSGAFRSFSGSMYPLHTKDRCRVTPRFIRHDSNSACIIQNSTFRKKRSAIHFLERTGIDRSQITAQLCANWVTKTTTR